jgi:molybdenum cofactor cytidylyltransferase
VGKIAAIILAAGGSSRFGKPKQLLKLSERSLVRRTVDEAGEAGCSPVVVVTGNARDEVECELTGTAAVLVDNRNWKRGIGTSIRAGVGYLIGTAPETDAAVLLVCDQPLVDAKAISALITLHEETQKRIVSSRYAQTLGVPALFHRACFEELLALHGDSGAKSIILSNRKRVAEFPFPDGAIDVDTIQDWENLSKRAAI